MRGLVLGIVILGFVACDRSHSTSQAEPTAEQQVASKLRRIAEVPSGPSTYSLQCVNRIVCSAGDFKQQWRTDDAGKHWDLIYSSQGQGDEVNTLMYVDQRLGWLLTLTKLFKTEDGGKNWIEQKPPLQSAGELRTLAFAKEGVVGWAGGGVYRAATKSELVQGLPNNLYDAQNKLVLEQIVVHTTDAGKTWVPQVIPKRIGRVYGISFVNERQGIALGDSGTFFTVDGGEHWQDVAFKKNCTDQRFLSGYDMRPLEAFFLDSKNVWLTWEDGRITKSTDGGESWCDLLLPGAIKFNHYDQYFKRIYFTDMNRGLGLGANRKIYETVDGGKSWTQLFAEEFDDVYFHQKQSAWLISKAGIFELSL